MFSILFLAAIVLVGVEIAGILMGSAGCKTEHRVNKLWIFLPTAFLGGTLLMTWSVYLLSWMIYVGTGSEDPLKYGNLICLALVFLFLILVYMIRDKKGRIFPVPANVSLIENKARALKELVFFLLLLFFIAFTMTYVFFEKDGRLYSGFTVFGDYAPHTAMMRSFSKGTNFPTQYPHFGGEDIKYHFMFQFLVGNLEYLGMRLDVAYNLMSSLSLLFFLMMLYQIAYRISGRISAGVLASVFFFFRSGTSFFRFVTEHLKAGNLWETLAGNTQFIGYTEKENWGLWCYNVYLNQRHLAFGLLAAACAIWFFIPSLETGCRKEEKGFLFIKNRFFSAQAWKSRDLTKALLLGMLLGLTSFFNGAAVIGALLILLGFAIFSDEKLDYAVMAFVTVVFTLLQTKTFISGNGISPSFYWGFISEDKSLIGVLWFLFCISFVSLLGLISYMFFLKREHRLMLAAFFFPVIFAFTGSLTPDITVNHKYIMIAWAFMAAFWGKAISQLWTGRFFKKAAAVVLTVCLTATGFYDFVVILKDNDSSHRISVSMNSEVTDWLADHLTSDDLILTPEYSMNEVTMSGVMMYMGWPYYAWSAGYDTYYRAAQAVIIYTTEDPEELRRTVEQEQINYILFEDDMTYEERQGREETIAQVYPLVFTSPDGRIRIYAAG